LSTGDGVAKMQRRVVSDFYMIGVIFHLLFLFNSHEVVCLACVRMYSVTVFTSKESSQIKSSLVKSEVVRRFVIWLRDIGWLVLKWFEVMAMQSLQTTLRTRTSSFRLTSTVS
jgi:hypothetical protein